MLIDRLRAERLAAMKARDERRKNLLGTLMAAAAKETKEPDDETVVRTLRAFKKSLEETVGLLEARGREAAGEREELAILEEYLPRPLDEAALEASIAEIVAGLPERSPKAMGAVMAALKARHGAALDPRRASALVKARLA
ncbi:GatB/YqeY domain-containing protein [Geminicoccaceae bacterium 1502E]|nr:GatB/YqeY domain-containing protein [Geminicoccaceae bacterium 1502E]